MTVTNDDQVVIAAFPPEEAQAARGSDGGPGAAGPGVSGTDSGGNGHPGGYGRPGGDGNPGVNGATAGDLVLQLEAIPSKRVMLSLVGQKGGDGGYGGPGGNGGAGAGGAAGQSGALAVIAAVVMPDKAETAERAARPGSEVMAGQADMRRFLFRRVYGKSLRSSSKHRFRSPHRDRRERPEAEGVELRVAEPVTVMGSVAGVPERDLAHRGDQAAGQM